MLGTVSYRVTPGKHPGACTGQQHWQCKTPTPYAHDECWQSQRSACPRPAAAAAAAGSGQRWWPLYRLEKKKSQPPPPLLLLVRIFSLNGIRAIFINFVTFSTKHGSTLDKACVRLLGSRYVQANAHRWPRSHFWVFAAQTSSLSDYILDMQDTQYSTNTCQTLGRTVCNTDNSIVHTIDTDWVKVYVPYMHTPV